VLQDILEILVASRDEIASGNEATVCLRGLKLRGLSNRLNRPEIYKTREKSDDR